MTVVVTPPPPRTWGRAFFAGLVVLAVLSVGLRLHAQKYDYFMMDEYIADAVVGHVLEVGKPDTNWVRTRVIREFRYDQFNFSSYYLASALALSVASSIGVEVEAEERVRWLRAANAVLAGVALVLIGLVGLRLGGPWAGSTAALLGATQVSLIQDALYARPEMFVVVLTLVLFLVVTGGTGPASRARAVVAGVTLGVLVACKITFAMLLPFVCVALLVRASGDRRVSLGLWLLAASATGFVVGVPYALLAPSEYLNGIHYLVTQYASGRPPHGALDGDVLSRFEHSGRYLLETAGWPALLLAALGAVLLARTPAGRAEKFLVGGILAGGLYFLQSRAFFERNLSHVLPFVFVLTGVGLTCAVRRIAQHKGWRSFAALALLVACLWRPTTVSHLLVGEALARPTRQVEQRELRRIELAGEIPLDALHLVDRIDPIAEHFCSGWVFRLDDVGDVRTARRLAEMQARGWIAAPMRIAGPFAGLQVSTLHTYHGGDVVFVRPPSPARPGCRLGLARLPAAATGSSGADRIERVGHAIPDGYPPQATGLPAGATAYGTWDAGDAPTGRIAYRGPLCPHQTLPIAAGPTLASLRLRIAFDDGSGVASTAYDGTFPTLAGGWFGLVLRDDSMQCTTIEVSVEDPSTAWGTWVGLGPPIERRAPPTSSPFSSTDTQ